MELNKIHNIDCLEFMKTLPDNSVDCIVTSPPYNMRTRIRNGKYTTREKSEHFSRKYTEFGDDLSIEEYYNFHKKVIEESLRISPILFLNIQIVTGSKEAWFKLIGDFNKNIKDVIIWDKGFGQPAMHESVMNRGHELILILESTESAGRTFSKSYFPRGEMQDIWRIGRGGKGEEETHTAVFPIELPSNILKSWTREKQTVLDPFMGTGTTAIACKMLNRNYIGCEISKEYCEIAEARIKSISNPLF